MKFFIIPAMTLLACLALASCKKDNKSPDPHPAPEYGITAEVDGKLISFSTQIKIDTNSLGQVAITGYTDNTNLYYVVIALMNGNAPLDKGVYAHNATIDNRYSVVAYTDISTLVKLYTSQDNTASITGIDDTSITGTFQATLEYWPLDAFGSAHLEDTKVFKNGKFHIPRKD